MIQFYEHANRLNIEAITNYTYTHLTLNSCLQFNEEHQIPQPTCINKQKKLYSNLTNIIILTTDILPK